MDGKKVAIILLVVVVVLFIVVLTTAPGSKDDKNSKQTDYTSYPLMGLFNSLVKKRSVRVDELEPSRSAYVFLPNQPLRLVIRDAKDVRVRTFKVKKTQGNEIDLDFTSNGDYGVNVKASLKNGNDAEESPALQVFKEGALLIATCKGPDSVQRTCGLQLIQ